MNAPPITEFEASARYFLANLQHMVDRDAGKVDIDSCVDMFTHRLKAAYNAGVEKATDLVIHSGVGSGLVTQLWKLKVEYI